MTGESTSCPKRWPQQNSLRGRASFLTAHTPRLPPQGRSGQLLHQIAPPQPSFHVTFLYQTPILQVRHPAGCITTLPRSSEVKNPPAMQMQVRSPRWEDSLEKEMATLSTILAWEIPRAEEPGGLQSRGRKRVRHDLATKQQRVIGPTLQPTWPQVGGIHLVCYT